ncbi:MAG TPA: ROK family transcriptional regulator [Streptosporangiaceae bacterium]|nr:ROK family transcriptional regulator [Streptosporangiaceae bacterium]
MAPRPGTPSLLRELNDRAALELLLTSGPMTRAELGVRTGLSKVTAAQLLGRLEERGLVQVTGSRSGGRGPNAAVYAVVPSTAYVAGLHVESDMVSAGIADVTGQMVAEMVIDTDGDQDPVALVHHAVAAACGAAGLDQDRLSAFVIGSPGVVDPRTGDVRLAVNIPLWHEGVLDALRGDLGRTVIIENDTNLAARAEHALGAARDAGDFALVWIGTGLGLAAVIGGRVHQGAAGAAGEIGYLPVPGVGLPENVRRPLTGSFQSLAGASGVRRLAASCGFVSQSASDVTAAAEAVAAAVALAAARAGDGRAAWTRELYGPGSGDAGRSGGAGGSGSWSGGLDGPGRSDGGAADGERARRFLDELAGRVALGVAAISVILDPGLVVLGGDIGLAGGTELARRVAQDVGRICPATPQVVPTGLPRAPVLRGAMLAAVEAARTELLASVAAS